MGTNKTFIFYSVQVNGVNSGSILVKNCELGRLAMIRFEDAFVKYNIDWNPRFYEQVLVLNVLRIFIMT